MSHSPAKLVLSRCAALANVSDRLGTITRTFASPAMRRANNLVASWMREAGMAPRVDAIGNLIGHYAAKRSGAPILLLGSHLDTVCNAGKFDGILGVVLAVACVGKLHRQGIRLPFAVEVVGFADEEGVRYQTTYLGSKVLAGCFNTKDLKRKDADGITMASAIKNFGGDPARIKSAALNPEHLLGYFEAHIEQGPVLEEQNLAVGIVTIIAGQTRARLNFTDRASHAGTTPMKLRHDALCAAAEFILVAEHLARKTPGLVATVGQIRVEPGATNVIPGEATVTLDLRHANDSVRRAAFNKLNQTARKIAALRKLRSSGEIVQETAATNCSEKLSTQLARSVQRHQGKILRLASGAGHDAAVMGQIAPAAMLFIRCKGGISHHPDESVRLDDVQVALDVMSDFIAQLARNA